MPALRTKWGHSDEQRKAAALAWFSEAAQRRKAEPRSLAGAADALREAVSKLRRCRRRTGSPGMWQRQSPPAWWPRRPAPLPTTGYAAS